MQVGQGGRGENQLWGKDAQYIVYECVSMWGVHVYECMHERQTDRQTDRLTDRETEILNIVIQPVPRGIAVGSALSPAQ